MSVPICPQSLPHDINRLVKELGRIWAQSGLCPYIETTVANSWSLLLEAWVADPDLPLLVRKSSMVRGSEYLHSTGRKIVPCDNAPAQWACNRALQGIVPTIDDIKTGFMNDTIPVSFAHKANEKEIRKYHCTLKEYSVNKAGWKLCHIKPVCLNSRASLVNIGIDEIQRAFIDLLSPDNFFLLPIQWGGLGEVREFIEGYASNKISKNPL